MQRVRTGPIHPLFILIIKAAKYHYNHEEDTICYSIFVFSILL